MTRGVPIAIALCLLGACVATEPPPVRTGERGGVVNPFAPASMRIHPLTHVDVDAQGRPIIVLHVEMRDRWGEPCKGVGSVIVELFQPASGPASGLERQASVWEVDLSDLELNAEYYDPATRTYRLQLSNPPTWITIDPEDQAARRARLNVGLTTRGPDGEQDVFEDSYVLRY